MERLWRFLKLHAIKIMDENIEYRNFPFHFFLLTLSGLWYPQSASSWIRFLFKTFSKIVMFLQTLGVIAIGYHFLNTFQVMDLFFFCTIAGGLFKTIQFSQKHKIIDSLLEEYSNEKCIKSNDEEEQTITKKFKTEIRSDTNVYFFD